MLRTNILFAIFLGLGLSAWMILSDFGGYTSRSALIIARSTSVVSTIDGRVADVSAMVGASVSPGALLVTIENDRIDRGRLTELRGRRESLQREIAIAGLQAVEFSKMMEQISTKAAAYLGWMTQDLSFQRTQTYHQLQAAEAAYQAKATKVEQVAGLLKKSHASVAVLEKIKSDAVIERNRMLALQAELARVDLRIVLVDTAGVLQDNGNASYWDELSNSMELRLLDNRQQAATMNARLAEVEALIRVESERFGKTFTEEHRAQFAGVINAVLTSKGERVIAGSNLLEVLDCANPIAIVSVPDHRFGDFFIGQKATIKPLDSGELIVGAVQHISSSALMRRDTSIAASPDLQVGGNKVIVAFRNQGALSSAKTCDTARRAAVTFETDTLLSEIGGRVKGLFGKASSGEEPAQTAALGRKL